MKNRNDLQVFGAILLSFTRACINFNLIIEEEAPYLKNIQADKWYPLEKFQDILTVIQGKYSEPESILEQIGIEMMNLWYHQGPGKNLIKKGIDFLHFQTSSEGYYSVIRGTKEQIGDFSLLALDEDKGTATIQSTTPFNKDMERGVLRGGLSTTTDLIYIDVDNSENENLFKVEFKDANTIKKNMDSVAELPNDPDFSTLYWKHKMLEKEFSRYNLFWNATNRSLSNAFEELGNQRKELREQTSELTKANNQLQLEIGRRRQAEKELKIYETMIESAQDAIFCKNLESRYISANDKTIEAFGLSRDAVIGKNDYELMPDPNEARQNVQDDQTVFSSGKTTEFHKHMTGADHKEYWFQAIKVPQFDHAGTVIGLVGIAKDITDLKQAENALRESEAELRALFAGMSDVVIMLDHEGRYLKIAPTKPELLYKPERELQGKSLHDIFHKEQADIFLKRYSFYRVAKFINKRGKIHFKKQAGSRLL